MKMSLPIILGIVFVVLKLCHVIAWSWIWVLCPFWAGIALAFILSFGTIILTGIAILIGAIFSKFK